MSEALRRLAEAVRNAGSAARRQRPLDLGRRRAARGPDARRGARAARGRGPHPGPAGRGRLVDGEHLAAQPGRPGEDEPAVGVRHLPDRAAAQRLVRRGEAHRDRDQLARLGARDRDGVAARRRGARSRAPAASGPPRRRSRCSRSSTSARSVEPTSTNAPSRSDCDTSVSSSRVKTSSRSVRSRSSRSRQKRISLRRGSRCTSSSSLRIALLAALHTSRRTSTTYGTSSVSTRVTAARSAGSTDSTTSTARSYSQSGAAGFETTSTGTGLSAAMKLLSARSPPGRRIVLRRGPHPLAPPPVRLRAHGGRAGGRRGRATIRSERQRVPASA